MSMFKHLKIQKRVLITILLKVLMSQLSEKPAGEQHTWVPRGLVGRRSDGEPFSVEATLSRTSGPTVSHTLILRDLARA